MIIRHKINTNIIEYFYESLFIHPGLDFTIHGKGYFYRIDLHEITGNIANRIAKFKIFDSIADQYFGHWGVLMTWGDATEALK